MISEKLTDLGRKHVLNHIEALLADGERRLPTTRRLAETADISYATMRLVMNALAREGFVELRQGSGTYVTERAAGLLAEVRVKRLLYFSPPRIGTPENSYGQWINATLLADAARRGWSVTGVIVNSHREFLAGAAAMRHQADAIVYLPVGEPLTLDLLGQFQVLAGTRFVYLGEGPGPGILSIAPDNRRGGAQAASKLLAANHRRIGLLFCEPHVNACMSRAQGFTETLELAGLEPVVIECHVGRDDDRAERAREALGRALADGLDVTALFAVSDFGAWGAMRALRDAGRRIPDDVSLIGFDGLPFTETLDPPLTSMRQPMEAIFATLFGLIEGSLQPFESNITLSPLFKNGGSVKTLPPAADGRRFAVMERAGDRAERLSLERLPQAAGLVGIP